MGGGLSSTNAGPGVRCALAAFVLLLLVVAPEARAYRAGLFCDGPDSTCFSGEGEFEQFAWVWTPGDAGLVYVTLRLSIPDNLQTRSEPDFDPRVNLFVKTGDPDGTEEWHMVLEGCPEGWVRVFRQQARLLDGAASAVVIRGGDSWIRDCAFDLWRVDVTNDLELNDPECGAVAASPGSWSALKARWE